MEYGIVIPTGIAHVRKEIAATLEDAENRLTALFRELLSELCDELVHLNDRIASIEQKLAAIRVQPEHCQPLLTIPGVGLLTATALIAAIGDITVKKNGRKLVWVWCPGSGRHD